MSKFTFDERNRIKSIVATLTLKRIPDNEIVREIFNQTNKSMTVRNLTLIKQEIKRDSYQWYNTLRQNRYEYLYEFKSRIKEIESLQKRHHEIIAKNEHNPSIQQTSLAELHRLSITLSNLFDVAPTIIGTGNGTSLSTTPEDKADNTTEESTESESIITV